MFELPPVTEAWEFLQKNSVAIGPQLHLLLWALGMLIIDFVIPAGRKAVSALLALGGIVMAGLQLYLLRSSSPISAFYDTVVLDSFATFFSALFLIAAAVTVFISYRYLEIENEQHTEYYALLLFATSGMMFMAAALDLITIFISLELMSISTYVLVGFLRRRRRSNEASLKYFLLGAFSTAIILYGMSLLYGVSGTTNLIVIGEQAKLLQGNTLLILAVFTIMAGLCFKVAAAPFHMWAPDAYEGAPTAVTGFMSVAVKAAAFALFLRIFFVAFHEVRGIYVPLLVAVSILTMTWGNVAAVTQQNVKRMLAYSSISHAGYVLMGLVAGTELGVIASAIYLLAYTFMNLGIWAVVILLRRQDISGEQVEDFDGLYSRHPSLAIVMLIFLLSLAGIPPLGGFIAKYFVFSAIIEVAMDPSQPYASLMVWLAVIGVINAVVSLYYYFRIVYAMFIQEEYQPAPLSFSAGLLTAIAITGIVTLLIGIYPQPFINLARAATSPLL
ncbi:MAG: NADH-quinone oxidoreductase subunit N [Acidobacteria bacterium]|nr:NADH-quinone oxidoreductase subunit N [Acidobacteriota bacterium]